MHRCDVRKAFRRLKHKKVWGVPASSLLEDSAHPTHHKHIKFLCVGGVLLSHNPTIAVPSAQSNLATGIGTGPGVPLTLTPPTQTHSTTTTLMGCVVSNTVQQTQTRQSSIFAATHIIPGAINTAHFSLPTHNKCVFCVGVLVPVTLQHVTMLTALAYQPHHLQGTSTETSSQNRLPA